MKIKLKKIIITLILFLQLFPYSNVLAAVTLLEAQEALVSYAVNFWASEYGELVTWYNVIVGGANEMYRQNAYTYGVGDARAYYNNRLYMDCAGWTDFAVHWCTGLEKGNLCFASPQGQGNRRYFDKYNSSQGYQPGDLIVTSGHIMIYIGKGKTDDGQEVDDLIIHSRSSKRLSADSLAKMGYNIVGYWRFNDNALSELDKSDLDYGGEIVSLNSNKNSESQSNLNMSNFYYNGIPDGKYSVTKGVFERAAESFGDLFNFIVGVATMWVRMIFVGWAAIVENLVTFTVQTATGGDDIESISVTSTDIESGNNITIEKIVFNQISIFDVNFFNFNDELVESEI